MNMKYTRHINQTDQLPGGEIVMSSAEGIVISIIGLREGIPFKESKQADSISSTLIQTKHEINITYRRVRCMSY